MIKYLKELCEICGASGSETAVADYIQSVISPYCECKIDSMGNLIAFKKGAQRPVKKVMLDAHMDEVGFIVTSVNDDGSMYFTALGGINVEALVSKRVQINGHVGVIQVKPVHLLKGDDTDKMPDKDSLTIDIGAKDREDALKMVSIGDTGTYVSDFIEFGDGFIKAKALDDRFGCAVLMNIIEQDLSYDMWFSFSTQEELGLRGAKTAAYTIDPDYAIAVEATTAADLVGVPENKRCCYVGKGAVLSFMDNSTLYDSELYRSALKIADEKGIKVQSKQAVAGGNNAGAIHQSRSGVKALTVSAPCRYLHSPSCVISKDDVDCVYKLVREVATAMCADSL